MQAGLWKQFEGHSIENTYRLTELLGVGGFGGVFLADHVIEDAFVRCVAIKLIYPDPEHIQQQLRELIIGTTLQHPHILRCFHAGSAMFGHLKLLYLVMEVAETSLQSRLAKGVLSIPEVTPLILQVTSALADLHGQKLIHRDIKPANVLHTSGLWKLSDFGTIRRSVGATSTRTDLIIGTPTYMPPESFDGVVSPAWDMWSLGVLLLESMVGQLPFVAGSIAELMRAILERDASIPASLPEPFAKIARGCLVKDYRDRWSATQVLETLERNAEQAREAARRKACVEELKAAADVHLCAGRLAEALTALREGQQYALSSTELQHLIEAVERQQRVEQQKGLEQEQARLVAEQRRRDLELEEEARRQEALRCKAEDQKVAELAKAEDIDDRGQQGAQPERAATLEVAGTGRQGRGPSPRIPSPQRILRTIWAVPIILVLLAGSGYVFSKLAHKTIATESPRRSGTVQSAASQSGPSTLQPPVPAPEGGASPSQQVAAPPQVQPGPEFGHKAGPLPREVPATLRSHIGNSQEPPQSPMKELGPVRAAAPSQPKDPVIASFTADKTQVRAGEEVIQSPTGAPERGASPALRAGATKVNPKDGLTYVWIAPGTFQMGCSPGDYECFDNLEKPAHTVTISKGFWIGQTEVTQAAFQRVMGYNPSSFKGPKRPVETIDWGGAKSYCTAAGMRLPTEAEWEYAARAGSSDGRYGDLDAIAWYRTNSQGETHDVGQKQANAWGVFDMIGNVWEWVADWYGSYQSGSETDPQGRVSGGLRALRGGSWTSFPVVARASSRNRLAPIMRYNTDIGVRCAGD